jgi:hypothetical protein
MTSLPTLHAVTERLSKMERIELEELAFEYVKSHAAVCHFADRAEPAPHADDVTISRRLGAMPTPSLVDLLAPAALLGVTAHELWIRD